MMEKTKKKKLGFHVPLQLKWKNVISKAWDKKKKVIKNMLSGK